MNDAPPIDLSVVIPVYNAETTIEPLTHRLVEVFRGRGALQVVLVNDGSRDRSHDACLKLVEEFPGVVSYVRLAKNFGESRLLSSRESRSIHGRFLKASATSSAGRAVVVRSTYLPS